MRDKFTAALCRERTATSPIRPSCLIIDEIGHCEFDKENTRLFFNLIDRRYNKEDAYNTILSSPATAALPCGERTSMRKIPCSVYQTESLTTWECSISTVRVSGASVWIHMLDRSEKCPNGTSDSLQKQRFRAVDFRPFSVVVIFTRYEQPVEKAVGLYRGNLV